MNCVRVTLKGGRKVCLAVPGNAKVMAEAKKGTLRHHSQYTDAEIQRGMDHGGHPHGAAKGMGPRGAGAGLRGGY